MTVGIYAEVRRIIGTATAVLLFCLPAAASAATIAWTGAANTNWFNAANWSPAQVPTSADNVTIDVNSTVVIAGPTAATFGSLVLGGAGGSTTPTLKVSGTISTSGSVTVNPKAILQQDTSLQSSVGALTVAPGGLLTHTANATTRAFVLNLNVAGDFNLQAGATITVNGQGYAANAGPGFGQQNNATGGATGGGHGGVGGPQALQTGGAANDSTVNPTDLGSGGGNAPAATAGGPGGGAVILNVSGSLILNGLINANGVNGVSSIADAGGGAGGTVNLTAAAITGSGSVQANGGAGGFTSSKGGGGGGGRIAITVTGSDSSSLNLQANPGNGGGGPGGIGGAGTIALKTPGGTNYNLSIGNLTQTPQAGTLVSGSTPAFSTVTLDNSIVSFDAGSTVSINSLVVVGSATMIANNLIFGANSPLLINPGAHLTMTASSLVFGANAPIEVKNAGVLDLTAQSISGGILNVRSGGLFRQMNATVLNFVSVLAEPGAMLTHGTNATTRAFILNLNVAGDFNLQAGATIAVNGKGYAANAGPGFGQQNNATGGATGGGHGGVGGSQASQAGGAANDSTINPIDLGSGGGNAPAATAGGPGGGAVILNVGGSLILNGLINANGVNGVSSVADAGGGAGGTVNLTATAITGSGTVQANGGAGGFASSKGGGGGGGRIAIAVMGSDSSSLNLQANPGNGGGGAGASGGAGTIALKTLGGANYNLSIGTSSNVVSFDPTIAVVVNSLTLIGTTTLTANNMTVNSLAIVGSAPGATSLTVNNITANSLVVFGTASLTAASLTIGAGSPMAISSGSALNLTAGGLILGANSPLELKGALNLAAQSILGGVLNVRAGGTFRQMNTAVLSLLSVLVEPGGLVTHAANGSSPVADLDLNVAGDFNLQAGGVVSADGQGYAGGAAGQKGFGPGDGGNGGTNSGGGGGHGGVGGNGDGTAIGGGTYDSVFAPGDRGSGGGGTSAAAGGAGGGAVILNVAGLLTIDGVVSANGAAGLPNSGFSQGGGGGSGGTISIEVASLAGSGAIRANGGSGASSGGAGGGGGRIALSYGSKTGSLVTTAAGGSGTGAGAVGTILDNGQLSGFNAATSTTSLSQMQSHLSSNQSLNETISAQSLDFAGATSTGITAGTFSRAQVKLVTVQTGSFAGKGLFTGSWTLGFLSGDSLIGKWEGTAFLNPSPREMLLNGVIEGDIRGILQGVLTESVPGSGNFDRLAVNCRAIQIGSQAGAADLYFSGGASIPQTVQYPGTPLSLLQTSITGQVSGYNAGPLETTFTLLRVNSPGNPYNGEGFFLPTYSAPIGTGVGWAYAATTPSQSVRLAGYFDQPLKGLFEGWLVTSAPQSLLLTLEKLDIGLPVQPILSVFTTSPHVATPAVVDSYSITIRNDGFATATNVTAVAILPEWSDFVSASGAHVVYDVSYWRPTQLYAPTPYVRWDLAQIPPRSSVQLNYQGRFRLLATGGPQPHEVIGGGNVALMSKAWADQIFAYYPLGGTQ